VILHLPSSVLGERRATRCPLYGQQRDALLTEVEVIPKAMIWDGGKARFVGRMRGWGSLDPGAALGTGKKVDRGFLSHECFPIFADIDFQGLHFGLRWDLHTYFWALGWPREFGECDKSLVHNATDNNHC
jgi:hypothetical protein